MSSQVHPEPFRFPDRPGPELEVYETVVRYKVATEGPIYLMFGDTMPGKLAPGGNMKWCQESARMSLEENVLPHISLRADTIQDFVTKACTNHSLSESFRADLRKTFGEAGSKHESAPKAPEHASPSAGYVSFSRVGFDSTLDEAVVETSFFCGGTLRAWGPLCFAEETRTLGSRERRNDLDIMTLG